jgi:hypothetical protein
MCMHGQQLAYSKYLHGCCWWLLFAEGAACDIILEFVVLLAQLVQQAGWPVLNRAPHNHTRNARAASLAPKNMSTCTHYFGQMMAAMTWSLVVRAYSPFLDTTQALILKSGTTKLTTALKYIFTSDRWYYQSGYQNPVLDGDKGPGWDHASALSPGATRSHPGMRYVWPWYGHLMTPV